ncbi:dephospho-CoA kinase [Orbus hercynius]|uniref:Dephospho-CoA kinase n=1 Tax=Orbus hercynius TaxID=593135 RepID=A0A495RHD8_9GAMM|nr:dephospho-CoA kinase [Orbus hercynius]RKS86839.1 dephospho-CoA kinase [Orbus hercynius]
MPYIVALSGGIASGKTTVTQLFAQFGVPIIDADLIARQVVEKGTPTLALIVQRFGADILLPTGDLDRAKLRHIIFNNRQQRIWLNQCLHPIIQIETEKQFRQSYAHYVIWVVPLLIENNLHKRADRILIIDTPAKAQIERLKKRDNINENLAKNMLSSQLSNAERIRYADDIIINNNQKSSLFSQVKQLHNKYLQLSQNSN